MMDCSCVYADDYDCPEFYHKDVRKARKEHVCEECRRKIMPGERYEHVRGKWDGRVDSYKTCADCLSIRDTFFCGGYGHGGVLYDFEEHIRCCDGHLDGALIGELTKGARDYVCDLVEEFWKENEDEG